MLDITHYKKILNPQQTTSESVKILIKIYVE